MLAPVPWQDSAMLAARVQTVRCEAAAARRTRARADPNARPRPQVRPRAAARELGGAHG